MSKNKFPSIEVPTTEARSMHNSIMQIKENVEMLNGTRRGISPSVTWDDLVRLGIVDPRDVPK